MDSHAEARTWTGRLGLSLMALSAVLAAEPGTHPAMSDADAGRLADILRRAFGDLLDVLGESLTVADLADFLDAEGAPTGTILAALFPAPAEYPEPSPN